MNDPILIVDGLNVFMRHFCANPSLSENGEHVGGFLGFLGGLGNLCEKFGPKKIVVVWESGGSPRKRAIAASYKKGRRPPKLNRYYEDDIPATTQNHTFQVSLLVKALNCLPVTQIYVRDCEADDVIGYLGRYVCNDSANILVSSDKDLYQLIDNKTRQWSPGQKRLIDKSYILEKFGISSENFVSARAFIGDGSDNIAGVKGAGFKTMSKWFPSLMKEEFVSCNEIVDTAKSLALSNKSKTIKLISESADLANKNWKLMHLDTSRLSGDQIHKIGGQLENIGTSNKMEIMRLMTQYGMQKFDINRHFAAINSVRNK